MTVIYNFENLTVIYSESTRLIIEFDLLDFEAFIYMILYDLFFSTKPINLDGFIVYVKCNNKI